MRSNPKYNSTIHSSRFTSLMQNVHEGMAKSCLIVGGIGDSKYERVNPPRPVALQQIAKDCERPF
jgi:hypothetical protein